MKHIETIAVIISLLFMVAISLYHVSYDGYLGLSQRFWEAVWAISNNGICLAMSIIVIFYSFGILRLLSIYVFIPYFALKLIYQFSVYSEIYLISPQTWETVWSGALVWVIIVTLLIVLIKMRYA